MRPACRLSKHDIVRFIASSHAIMRRVRLRLVMQAKSTMLLGIVYTRSVGYRAGWIKDLTAEHAERAKGERIASPGDTPGRLDAAGNGKLQPVSNV